MIRIHKTQPWIALLLLYNGKATINFPIHPDSSKSNICYSDCFKRLYYNVVFVALSIEQVVHIKKAALHSISVSVFLCSNNTLKFFCLLLGLRYVFTSRACARQSLVDYYAFQIVFFLVVRYWNRLRRVMFALKKTSSYLRFARFFEIQSACYFT